MIPITARYISALQYFVEKSVDVTITMSNPTAKNPHLPKSELMLRCRVTLSRQAIGFPETSFGLYWFGMVRFSSPECCFERSPNFLT